MDAEVREIHMSRITRRDFLGQASAAAAFASDWPEFRGQGDSIAGGKLPLRWSDEQGVVWSAVLPGYGQSSPVIQEDRVYLTSVEGPQKETLHVLCLDLKSGGEIWRRQFPAAQKIKNGDMTSKAAPTPCVDRNRLYVFFESGDLLALDHSGRTVWWRKLTEEYGPFQGNHGVGSSPRLTTHGLTVLVTHAGPSYLISVEKATGKNQWRAERESKTAWTTPCVVRHGGREQVIVSVNGKLESYDSEEGRPLWTVGGLKGNLLASASAAGDRMVVGSSEKGCLKAFSLPEKDGESPRELWTASNATCYFGSPLLYHGRAWLAGKVGVAWCVDLATGRELWNERLAGECWASPIGGGDSVFFFTIKGVTQIYAAAAQTATKIAENKLGNMERIYGVAAAEVGFVIRSGSQAVLVRS
jgi:outer membrane protein assembly factor BamB